MTPTDAAIAQAFREYDEGDIVQMRTILARARELDAEKGGEACPDCGHVGRFGASHFCTPPESGGQGEIPEAVASDEPGKWKIEMRGLTLVVSSSEAASMWNLLRTMVMRGNFAQGGGNER